jgi:FSR family fosmidomycin resistance protein-like MFS transporter
VAAPTVAIPSPSVLSRLRTRGTLLAMAVGHLGSDFSQGAVAAMLPFLREHRGYSYAQGTSLLLAVGLGASLAQPPFGILGDRRRLPWVAPVGVLAAAAALATIGFVDDLTVLFVVILLGGIGVAAFHPEGARAAAYASGERRAAGMSVFAVGGNLGFALAPLVVAVCLATFGLHGTLLVACVPLACAATLAAVALRGRAALARERAAHAARAAAEDLWRPFWTLAASASIRSGVYFGMQAFVPAYFVSHHHASAATGDAALTVMLAAGVVGTLAGGQVAERMGRRFVLIGGMLPMTPLLLLVIAAPMWLAFPLLALMGFFTISNMSTTVVMGQEYLPNRLGTASGVTLGLVISIGAGVAAAFGPLADATSPRTVLLVLAALPLFSLALAWRLPDSRRG